MDQNPQRQSARGCGRSRCGTAGPESRGETSRKRLTANLPPKRPTSRVVTTGDTGDSEAAGREHVPRPCLAATVLALAPAHRAQHPAQALRGQTGAEHPAHGAHSQGRRHLQQDHLQAAGFRRNKAPKGANKSLAPLHTAPGTRDGAGAELLLQLREDG